MKTCVSVKGSHLTEPLIEPVENGRFAIPPFAKVGRTLTPPRAGAPVAGHSLLPRWRTRVIQETPQWLPARGPSATLGPYRLIVGLISKISENGLIYVLRQTSAIIMHTRMQHLPHCNT